MKKNRGMDRPDALRFAADLRARNWRGVQIMDVSGAPVAVVGYNGMEWTVFPMVPAATRVGWQREDRQRESLPRSPRCRRCEAEADLRDAEGDTSLQAEERADLIADLRSDISRNAHTCDKGDAHENA